LADELVNESQAVVRDSQRRLIGYIVDIRKMTRQSTIEQIKAEEAAKSQGTGKPRAVLGKDAASGAIINMYTSFTGASRMSYFSDIKSAKAWLYSQEE
jgi:hypothetical protein